MTDLDSVNSQPPTLTDRLLYLAVGMGMFVANPGIFYVIGYGLCTFQNNLSGG